MNLEFNVPKEETFPIPLKHTDVTRSTHTDLDVMQEKRVDEYWNVDSNRNLSDSWKVFTKFTLLKEKLPKGYPVVWVEIDKTFQSTTRPDHVWPEVRTKIRKAAQNHEKTKNMGKREKSKVDNARRLRGICFIDPDDQDYKETFKNSRRKLEIPMAAVIPCKRKDPHCITKVIAQSKTASEKTPTTIYSCIVEAHESTRQRVESSKPKNHEDHIAGEGFTSMTH